MRILVAGATGAIGRQLVPRLVASGHEVHGMTRSASKRGMLTALGARPLVVDALDRDRVMSAVDAARPEAIVHQLTAISEFDTRHLARDFAPTNRLRIEGTDNLVVAAKASGVRRFVAQSHIVPYARTGDDLKSEEDPFDEAPVASMRPNQEAMEHLEDKVLSDGSFTGIVLRYGWFYGPHTNLGPGGEMLRLIESRRLPLIADGSAVWSFVHVGDAAEATVSAVERGIAGVYNIVDDEPAAVSVWLPTIANQLGAKPPWHLPRLVGRILAGEAGVTMMTELRGATNRKAREVLGWIPAHPSWRNSLASRPHGSP